MVTALARKVFPVPGAPYTNIPDLLNPLLNSSGCFSGNCMVSRISCLANSSPPTPFQLTVGT